ncbi:N6-adenosine-methyltransferase catalytic subunit [Taenia solium]|eukprot:TsM_001135800 transcript=TsM_001135800 gene=TsM_001135800
MTVGMTSPNLKCVHYEIGKADLTTANNWCRIRSTTSDKWKGNIAPEKAAPAAAFLPPYSTQWIKCDFRQFDTTIIGTFAVIMDDPQWDIHMEPPYSTRLDDEMRKVDISYLQDNGSLLF